MLAPGAAVEWDGWSLRVLEPVGLPGPLSSEPSIATAADGVVAVAAPASRSGPGVMLTGGYLWVSRDGGATFELVLDPTTAQTPAGFCSCDTDVVSDGKRIFATTMYFTVNPLFNANLVASEDAGRTWDTRALKVAEEQPIDRPWLAVAPDGTLLFTYEPTRSLASMVNDKGSPVLLQTSRDGGRSWSEPVTVAPSLQGGWHAHQKPVALSASDILVPLERSRLKDGTQWSSVVVLASHDGGVRFEPQAVSGEFPSYATFSFSLHGMESGRAVVAWSEPDPADGTQRIHFRRSDDFGRTWGVAETVPDAGNALQPSVALRADGLLAIAYHGTDATGPVLQLGPDAAWEPRAVLVPERGPPALARLSEAPIFKGPLCNLTPSCPDDAPATPMREFLGAAWDPEGGLHVAFTDASQSPPDVLRGRVTVTRVVLEPAAARAEHTKENVQGAPPASP